MKNNSKIKSRWIVIGALLVIASVISPALANNAWAEEEKYGFGISPMKEKMVLNPGDKYSSAVTVYVPGDKDLDMKYSVEIAPYFVNENYQNDFMNEYGTNNEIVKWMTIDSPTEGILSPGQEAIVKYSIDVPEDAAGGGQYASILVSADIWKGEDDNNGGNDDGQVAVGIKEEKKIAHTIFVEIAGDIERGGEVYDLNVPGFLLGGDIVATSAVKNSGNTHGEAKYKLQVFPLFSNEEIYTNEETPEDRTILPGRTLVNETVWYGTPAVGIFNIIYTVEFEGEVVKIEKMVIKCPVWLLFIIVFVIAALVIYFMTRSKARKKAKAEKKSVDTE